MRDPVSMCQSAGVQPPFSALHYRGDDPPKSIPSSVAPKLKMLYSENSFVADEDLVTVPQTLSFPPPLSQFRRLNKLECLSLASLSSLFLYLRVRPGDFPRREYLNGAPLGEALALLANIRLTRDKRSSLFCIFVGEEEKRIDS
jgi:hypothetical protein